MMKHFLNDSEYEEEEKKIAKQKKMFKLYVLFTNDIPLYQIAIRLMLENNVSFCRVVCKRMCLQNKCES